MTTATIARSAAKTTTQISTFFVGDILLGLDISHVQEINRHLDVTAVPHSPSFVRGVINLRGEVVTVVDMRQVLGLAPVEITKGSRNVVIHFGGELVGLMVDRIGDVLTIADDEISPPPAHIRGIEHKCFRGVHALESGIVVILDVNQVLADS